MVWVWHMKEDSKVVVLRSEGLKGLKEGSKEGTLAHKELQAWKE